MPSENEFTSALYSLAGFLEDIGYSDADLVEHEDSDVITIEVADENPVFKFSCSPDWSYWPVSYDYSLINAIATQIDEADAEEHIAVGYEDLQDEYEADELAAHSIIDLLGPDEREEILFHLQESVFSHPVSLEIRNNTINNNFSSFIAWKGVFPYDDDFSRTRLDQSVGEVAAAGNRAQIFLRYAFNLGIEGDRDDSTDFEKEVATSPRTPP